MGALPAVLRDMAEPAENHPAVLPFYSHTKNFEHAAVEDVAVWKGLGVRTDVFSNLFDCKCAVVPQDGVYREMGLTEPVEFPSTEHYFQMCKYGEEDRNFMILLNPRDVAAYGQRRLKVQQKHLKLMDAADVSGDKKFPALTKHERVNPSMVVFDWAVPAPGHRVTAMWRALRAKFTDSEDLKEVLLATGNAWLVEHTKNDSQWADALDGSGLNLLGKLLVLLRAELAGKATQEDVEMVVFGATDEGFLTSKQSTWIPDYYSK